MRGRIIGLKAQLNHFTSRRHIGKPPRVDAHMNELPVPCEPWEPWYSDKQAFYNKVLVGGTLWCLFSFGFMIYSGSFFLNFFPPDVPGPPSDAVEECDDTE